MKKTILKTTFREIRYTLPRFLAILIIIAIGTTFYVGLKSVGPDMAMAADDYFTENNLMDYQMVSTMGITAADIEAMAALPSVSQVDAVYTLDALESYGEAESKQTRVARLISLPDGNDAVSRLSLVAGRLPENPGECVVDSQEYGGGPEIGSVITLSSGTEEDLSASLARSEYTVVGIADSPMYLTLSFGTSSLGNGFVAGLIYVPKEDFSLSVYTGAYLKAEGAGEAESYSEAYDQIAGPLQYNLEELAKQRAAIRYDEIVTVAKEALAEKQAAFDKAKTDADAQFAAAKKKLDDGASQLAAGEKTLRAKKAEAGTQLASGQKQLEEGQAQLAAGQAAYESNLAEYRQALAAAETQLAAAKEQIAALDTQISAQSGQLRMLQQQLAQGVADGSLTPEQKDALNNQIGQLQTAVAALQSARSEAQTQLDAATAPLNNAKSQLEAAKAQLTTAAAELASQKERFQQSKSTAEAQFATQEKLLKEKKTELAKTNATYEEEKSSADKKFADAETELADAAAQIEDIAPPEWHVLSRDENAGYADYESTIKSLNGFGSILPPFFFAVAALVCLTTMTRMVDEQRTQIGTLKALGYRNFDIAKKYIIYAAAASVLGAVLGIAVGSTLIPTVVINAYGTMYSMPGIPPVLIVKYAVFALVLSVAVTAAAAMFTCYKDLRSVPAALMRPAAPRAGKRIFLERIGFIWRRLKFSHKVTARNLFRYKKRFWMTTVGVACCCALLLTGLGLKDSVAGQVAEKQFGELIKYDMTVQLDSEATDAAGTISGALASDGNVAGFTGIKGKIMTAHANDKEEAGILMVPGDTEGFSQFVNVRTPGTLAPLTLPDDGVIITEKLADLLSVGIGDTITIEGDNAQDSDTPFTVAAIAENYLWHYVYMSPAVYQGAYGSPAGVNQYLAILNEDSDDAQDALSSALMDSGEVSSVGFISDDRADFKEILDKVNYVVWVIIILAGLLALVVLFTLTTINVSERTREIATIKVLGFYDPEVSGYVYREGYILTLIGAAIGLVGGIFLHRWILQSVAVDMMMYVPQILPRSFLLSIGLCLFFTWLVNRIVMRRIRRINMVEALKSTE